jgi:NitT/TauT family transport system permease protein
VARAAFLAVFLALWQGAVALGLADPAFVSSPASVVGALWHLVGNGDLGSNLLTTLVEIMMSFVLSVMFGIASALVLDRSDWANRILSPFLTAFNSMPRIALGPLFILWFGIGIASKVVLAVSLGYFIMLLSTLGGLKNVDRDLLLMSRLFGASELRLFRDVRLPETVREAAGAIQSPGPASVSPRTPAASARYFPKPTPHRRGRGRHPRCAARC